MSSAFPDPTPMLVPLFLGNAFNWLGLGALIVQCCIGYSLYTLGVRCFLTSTVYGVFFLELVQTATTTHQAWWYMITNWNDPSSLLTFPWSAMTVPTMAGLIAAAVQFFYAWRIWTLSTSKIIRGCTVLIIILAIAQCTSAIVVAAVFQADATAEHLASLHPEFSFWIASSFVADVLVAACMLWVLNQAKTQSMVPDTSSLLTKLIVNTIGTGSAIALCGTLTLALFLTTVGFSFQYLPAAYILGKLYSNSVMVTLNARKPRVSRGHTSQGDSLPMRIFVSQDQDTDSQGAHRKPLRSIPHKISGDFRAQSKSTAEP
ncbi:hypothetical protein C8J57DRAFT_1177128 [Mycena rebaudengoi]|nr:hypothetical protein C8J57DRAFT_1177128 [Mycena rebaudengoi]